MCDGMPYRGIRVGGQIGDNLRMETGASAEFGKNRFRNGVFMGEVESRGEAETVAGEDLFNIRMALY